MPHNLRLNVLAHVPVWMLLKCTFTWKAQNGLEDQPPIQKLGEGIPPHRCSNSMGPRCLQLPQYLLGRGRGPPMLKGWRSPSMELSPAQIQWLAPLEYRKGGATGLLQTMWCCLITPHCTVFPYSDVATANHNQSDACCIVDLLHIGHQRIFQDAMACVKQQAQISP